MNFIVQKTKRSCVSVAIYNSFVYWDFPLPNLNQLRKQLKECKDHGGVLWKDLRVWLNRHNVKHNTYFDKDLKKWNNPLSICLVSLDYEIASHCVIVRKMNDHSVWLINEDKKTKWKTNYRMSKTKFQNKLKFYMIINPK